MKMMKAAVKNTDPRGTVAVVRTVLEGKGKSIMNKVNIRDLNDKCAGLKSVSTNRLVLLVSSQ